MAYYRGFKAEAERLAVSTRQEMGLKEHARLDPHDLAAYLAIDVVPLSTYANSAEFAEFADDVHYLQHVEPTVCSAYTVFEGSERTIVHNDVHPLGRQASNIAHELSHGLLLHAPSPVLDILGCRNWKSDIEDEANYLAGALLVPSKAAWSIAKRRVSFDRAATEYGCSTEMIRWRVNITGAGRIMAS